MEKKPNMISVLCVTKFVWFQIFIFFTVLYGILWKSTQLGFKSIDSLFRVEKKTVFLKIKKIIINQIKGRKKKRKRLCD